jgi:DNA polymerase I-like protein with 3'-5' exonuclease and polymerase domains
MRYIADIESNGFLDKVTTIHCLVLKDLDTRQHHRFNHQPGHRSIEEGLALMQQADLLVMHNGISFDYPVIQKLHPGFTLDESKVLDTLVMARLIYPDLWDIDTALYEKGKLPGNLRKRQSLEAWGHRLGLHKGDYSAEMKAKGLAPWAAWNMPMEDYCCGDTDVTEALFKKLEGKNYSQMAIELEHQVAWIITAQERRGFSFDKDGAAKLLATLVKEKLKMEEELTQVFKPMWMRDGKVFIPKRADKKRGYEPDVPFQKIKLTEFNPTSRDHIALWLKRLYGWKPLEFGKDGKPTVDEEVLAKLPYKEAEVLQRYLMIGKRLGQLAEGKEAWLRHEKNGRIHGSVMTNGAVTGRATHSKPNVAQVPSVGAPFGGESRALFRATPGLKLVGTDLSGIELRCLAHYMARWDGGAYGEVLLNGDIHTANQEAAGLPTRANAKTFIYGFLYGAGVEKIGSIVGKGRAEGTKLRNKFLASLPALKSLIDAVQKKAKEAGVLIGLDGRQLHVRSAHSALNTLLQSAGALVSKRWLVEVDLGLKAAGIRDRVHQVAWIHDEVQLECPEELTEVVAKITTEAAAKAGEFFKFRLPIAAEAQMGTTWKDVH